MTRTQNLRASDEATKMTSMRSFTGTLLGCAFAACFAASPAAAGSIDLAWDPPSTGEAAGYRVFYDTQPGPGYRNFMDVDNVTSYTFSGLADCTVYYAAVKSRNAYGQLARDFSNEIQGSAHPEISSLSPRSLSPGQTAQIIVTGPGIAPGAVPEFVPGNGNRVTIDAYNVEACGRMTMTVTVDANAAYGTSADLEITNPDGGHNAASAALQIGDPSAPLQVISVNPSAGRVDVDPGSSILVRFARRMDPTTMTSSRFRLARVGAGGQAALAAGFPSLSPDGLTVSLKAATPLEAGQSYAVVVKGGAKGVHDTAGIGMAADFSSAFGTAAIFRDVRYGPEDSPTDLLTQGSPVPVSSSFTVNFSEPMNPADINAANFKIARSPKGSIALEGIPVLSADGMSVLLDPVDLPTGTSFIIQVKGGPKGAKSARGVVMADRKIAFGFTTNLGAVEGAGIAE